METIQFSLLRGICQLPGYIAHAKGFFGEQGLEVNVNVAPTAWMVPERLLNGEVHFAVMPWTRVAAARAHGEPLVTICGSGHEEAAIVVRAGLRDDEVRKVAIPQRGGIKDLTAMGMLNSLGWDGVELVRMPSGDGAILALVGQGADAASMVEPYATMLSDLGIGRIVRRTGDLWPGAPGCSLTTTASIIEERPDLVRHVVAAFVQGAQFVEAQPDESAAIAAGYIGVGEKFIRNALRVNKPNLHALENSEAIQSVLNLMTRMRYIESAPRERFYEGSFLKEAVAGIPA
ncbi:ABC-type nitrate/sulfonate/bicarbonate transport systems periplasmic components-like protein [Chthoniobacter flavus Ellin428]|uniref:ABC-type nitrate/sulfonate/bicarbonate transport systems periplasmic components-like protein n=1 Tax=Chthoniobacter flavus Ellin428 TaxID=497964 RepID=B4D0Y3_9BACT|nr:ABC transporter substrate-binding protein [Chthoniobacter flavus]EDY19995.1 ABC-type nitrate/sulfonate/bicarbonate transport systems periplasmic components-like protein [Chthoniobacter flavus Ellin428]TCO91738.1 NMT1-like family protein [Chthoniobacter flavus]